MNASSQEKPAHKPLFVQAAADGLNRHIPVAKYIDQSDAFQRPKCRPSAASEPN
jgi:hypothetical protein